METLPVPTLNLTGVLSESTRIIRANYTHFLSLSLLFLPLSFSLFANPGQIHFPPNHHNLPLSHLLYILIPYVITLCAIATVTYSAHNAFFGEPVSLFAAFKSLTFSFFPILSTAIVAHFLLFMSLSFVLLLVGSVLMLVQYLGLVIDYNSIYFMSFSAVVFAILLVVVIYIYVNWSLAFVVVVVESKWGFAPLKRSAYLVKGMRSASLLLQLYLGSFGGLLVWGFYWDLHFYSSSWGLVLMTILGLFFLMMILVRSTAANTVLYNYCRTLHGELAIGVADHAYINLPSDDHNDKITHVVVTA